MPSWSVLLPADIRGLGGTELEQARRRATLIADAAAFADGWIRAHDGTVVEYFARRTNGAAHRVTAFYQPIL